MSNKHILTEEILKDISDTEYEIQIIEREMIGLRMMSDRMSHFRADARVSGIAERKLFIEKLKKILIERDQPASAGEGVK